MRYAVLRREANEGGYFRPIVKDVVERYLDCGNPKCGGQMKVVAFITDYAAVGRIIDHLKLTFAAEKPPPPAWSFQDLDMVADPPVEYIP